MFKQLLQLLLETFLKSKKEWISSQSFPSVRSNINLDTKEYIPPCNGWIGVYRSYSSNGTSLDFFAFGDVSGHIVARAMFSSKEGAFGSCATIPVKKGCKVIFNETKGITELWFSPSVAGKS